MHAGIVWRLVTVAGLLALGGQPALGQDEGTTVSDQPVPEVRAVPRDAPSATADALPASEPEAAETEGANRPAGLPDVAVPEGRGWNSAIGQLPDEMQPGPLRWRERMWAPAPYPPPTFFDPQMGVPNRVHMLSGAIRHPFYLGVSLQPVSAALRSHLKLDPAVGLLVEGIATDSPAAAVLQPYDVLTDVDDYPITQHDDLVQAVQKAGSEERELKLSLIRAGQSQTVTVKPIRRTERELIFRSDSMEPAVEERIRDWVPVPAPPADQVVPPLPRPGDEWFEQYRREQNELRQLIEKLRRDIDELRGAERSSESD